MKPATGAFPRNYFRPSSDLRPRCLPAPFSRTAWVAQQGLSTAVPETVSTVLAVPFGPSRSGRRRVQRPVREGATRKGATRRAATRKGAIRGAAAGETATAAGSRDRSEFGPGPLGAHPQNPTPSSLITRISTGKQRSSAALRTVLRGVGAGSGAAGGERVGRRSQALNSGRFGPIPAGSTQISSSPAKLGFFNALWSRSQPMARCASLRSRSRKRPTALARRGSAR